MADESTNINPIRKNDKKSAIVFIHGFSGDLKKTWGQFPEFLSSYPELDEWDLYSYGYPTRLMFDLVSIWQADPPLDTIAISLRDTARYRFTGYEVLTFVAHSMGGLVLQQALLKDSELAKRVRYVFLFGTPSGGLAKASLLGRLLKRQVRDMYNKSDFITQLRQQWDAQYGTFPPFRFLSVAGDKDEFVPRSSSIDVFPENARVVVPGNHLQIVKPQSRDSLSVLVVLKELTETNAVGVTRDLIAKELRSSNEIIRRDMPNKDKLTGAGTVALALALDRVGRREDAIDLLEAFVESTRADENPYTDAFGTLAGRYKRRFLLRGLKDDGEKAHALYSEACDLAQKKGDWNQAFYNGINHAFMELAYKNNLDAARTIASQVLDYCEKAAAKEPRPDPWRLAAEAEAHLVLGEHNEALASYKLAWAAQNLPWMRESVYQQAVWVVGLVADESTATRLHEIFRGKSD